MHSKVTFQKPWRYRDHKRGFRVIDPGIYQVPEDLPDYAAGLAVDQGMATMVRVDPPKTEPPKVDSKVEQLIRAVGGKKRGRPRKNGLIETKIEDAVAENKSGVV